MYLVYTMFTSLHCSVHSLLDKLSCGEQVHGLTPGQNVSLFFCEPKMHMQLPGTGFVSLMLTGQWCLHDFTLWYQIC